MKKVYVFLECVNQRLYYSYHDFGEFRLILVIFYSLNFARQKQLVSCCSSPCRDLILCCVERRHNVQSHQSAMLVDAVVFVF